MLKKEFYFLVGGIVAKMKIETERCDEQDLGYDGRSAGIRCTVEEIDGRAVPDEQRKKLVEVKNVKGTAELSQEDCARVVENVLRNFDLLGPIKIISDSFAQDQVRINRVKKEIREKRRER